MSVMVDSGPRFDEALAVVRAHEHPNAKLVRIIGTSDADDATTVWDVAAVFEVPRDCPTHYPAWPRQSYQIGDRAYAEVILVTLPSNLMSWDAPEYRAPVEQLVAALGAALGVETFVSPVGEPAREWHGGTWLDRQ